MKHPRTMLALFALALVAVIIAVAATGQAQQPQTIKIGILYDHSGPFSAAGSLNCWRGAKMMIDYINEKGGVLGKYKIIQADGDSQSKADVAINEAERLLNVEKVDILAGVYSSAHAVPIAERVDKQKKFLWITTAIADAVLKDRNLQYTFRPQPNGSLFGVGSVAYIASYAPWSPHMNAWSGDPVPDQFIHGTTALERQGALVFQVKQCRNCHSLGESGGQRGPALDTVALRLTQDQLIRQVIQGGGNMPAYGKNLSPAETTALVAFLETLHPKGQAPARDASRDVALREVLRNDEQQSGSQP
jgi:mono/diheme cytochrome c family protein